MEGGIGNRFVDLLWSSREQLGPAETEITERKYGVKLSGLRKIGGKLTEEEHAGLDSVWD